MLPSAIAGSTRDFCASLPPSRTAVPPSTTVARYGSSDQRAAERLHHQHDLDRAAAEPAVFLGERQAEQAEFGVLRPHARRSSRPAP